MADATTPVPLISVLMPVYNAGAFLPAAVESILAQSLGDFECLVLDDGSTDGSGEVLARYAARDPRIRLIRRENRGLVATLNELIGVARGDLLARMDADDIALPDRFARQREFLKRHPEVVCVGGGQILMDEHSRNIAPIRPPADDAPIQALALRGHGSICHPTAMIRMSAMQAVGGYLKDYYPAEDLDLWLRLGEVGRLANLVEPVLRYRVHSGSISGQAAQGRQRDAGRRACADAAARRGLPASLFDANESWRPDEDRASRLRFMLQYGWMAQQAGYRRTAIAYALKSIGLQPGSSQGWRLLASGLLRSGAKGAA